MTKEQKEACEKLADKALDSVLKEIQQRTDNASEGPWESKYQNWSMLISHNKFETYLASTKERNNADFIAHARTDVPMLLEMVEETIKSIGHHGCFCAGDNDGSGASYFCLGHELQRDLEKIAGKYK